MNCCRFLIATIFTALILRVESNDEFHMGSGYLFRSQYSNDSEIDLLDESDSETIDNRAMPQSKYPFMVSIQTIQNRYYKHICGGTILNKDFVLTAAHCTLKPTQLYARDLYVVAGSDQIFGHTAKRFQVRSIRKHKRFKPLHGHDILLLRVEPPIPIDNVHFASIQFRRTSRQDGGVNTLLLGWGRIKAHKVNSLALMYFRTLEDKDCFHNHRFKYLTESEICAVNTKGARGACDGDSGGPLIDVNQRSIYGILSYGRRPCEQRAVYAFTRISTHIEWIEQNMRRMS